jgi:DNA processing protein
MERYDGSAAAVLADLPNLAKKAGARAGISAPPAAEIERELEAATKLGAFHLAVCEPDYSTCLAAIDSPPPVIAVRGGATCSSAPPSPWSAHVMLPP